MINAHVTGSLLLKSPTILISHRYSNCDKSVPQTGSAYVTYLARPYFKFVMMITMMMMMVVVNVMLVMMVVTMIMVIMTLVIMVIMNIMRIGQPRQSKIA